MNLTHGTGVGERPAWLRRLIANAGGVPGCAVIWTMTWPSAWRQFHSLQSEFTTSRLASAMLAK